MKPIHLVYAIIGLSYGVYPLQSSVLLQYDGVNNSYVSADVSYSTTASATGSYAHTNAWNSSSALSPSSGYSGPKFYGGYQYTNNTVSQGFSRQQVRNNLSYGTASNVDAIFMQVANVSTSYFDGSTMSFAGCILFKREDFASGYTAGALQIDSLNATVLSYGSVGFTPTLRWVVQVEDKYYVSQTTFSSSGSGSTSSLSGTALSTALWTVYTPDAQLNFDQSSPSYVSLNLSNIQAVGLYFEEDSWIGDSSTTSSLALGISQFSITGIAIPEPKLPILLGCGSLLLILLYCKRQKA